MSTNGTSQETTSAATPLVPPGQWLLARGQMLVTAALMLSVLMGLVGAGVDYGFLVIERARLQNAMDAAALAAARALVAGTNPGTSAATTTADSYMALHGYVRSTSGPTTAVGYTTINYAFSASPGQTTTDTITVTASRVTSTYFWKAISINTVTISGSSKAAANGAMVDVMLTLDLTGSMELSGTSDLAQLQQAVVDFINQMNPDATQPYGAKVGMARWAGVGCSWARGLAPNTTGDGHAKPTPSSTVRAGTPTKTPVQWTGPTPNPTTGTWLHGDGDSWIDLNNATVYGASSWTEYVPPCYDDLTVLSNLNFNKGPLIKLANNTDTGGTTTCPTAMPSGSLASFACPLTDADIVPPQILGTPATPQGYDSSNNGTTAWYTGTKLPNAMKAVCSNVAAGNCDSGYFAWDTANGGRNNEANDGYARKVLVMMTDGFNEIYPTTGTPVDLSTWDTDVVTYANTIKLGKDGVAGTSDDVEIYVVGFFCTPYSAGSGIPQKWCKSQLADTTAPHPCPGTTYPPSGVTPTTIDTLLKNISSSTTGSCDHYYPIKKTESLPTLFRVIAGSVARGRLGD
jgi:Flp pilus assembly protein TadG